MRGIDGMKMVRWCSTVEDKQQPTGNQELKVSSKKAVRHVLGLFSEEKFDEAKSFLEKNFLDEMVKKQFFLGKGSLLLYFSLVKTESSKELELLINLFPKEYVATTLSRNSYDFLRDFFIRQCSMDEFSFTDSKSRAVRKEKIDILLDSDVDLFNGSLAEYSKTHKLTEPFSKDIEECISKRYKSTYSLR